MAELLLELFSEEIPARMQVRAADDLLRLVTAGLAEAGLPHGQARSCSGPRRLVLCIDDVALQTEAVSTERKGPRVDAPEKAIEGFLKSAGVSREDCEVVEDKKGAFLLARIEQPGRQAADVITETVTAVINKFPWPKSMRWGSGSLRWVRPLHSILCCLDGKVVPFEIEGIKSGKKTAGHRFMAPNVIVVENFATYEASLRQAKVLVDANERAEAIRDQALNHARIDGLELIEDEGLLHETAGLVEWPVVLMGEFDESFLEVPPEVIITSIKSHQKCFALRHVKGARKGRLANRYLMVSNLVARDNGEKIVKGNNRVIAARLSDARFFWDQDRKKPLEDLLPELENITFHAKLGTQRERVKRVETLAAEIANTIGADSKQTQLAARLCKTDLVTGMVGEFPELQGLMGSYYARAEGLGDDVAAAIRDHYKPQGPSDAVPMGPVSQAVALADKIDTLVGFWAIDEKPTGSKDPYALRRAALGVIRIILENDLRVSLGELVAGHLQLVTEAGIEASAGEGTAADLLSFFADRLKVYLRDQGQRHDLIDAVFALGNQDDLLMIVKRVEALGEFLETEDGKNLLAGVKRASNILRIEEKKEADKPQNERADLTGKVVQNLLVQGEEKDLFRAVEAAEANAAKAIRDEDFAGAMRAMAKLRKPVDAFFEEVTVNADDPTFRENRLKLLNRIRAATLTVADFSRIEG